MNRIREIDALRGIALFGILLVNIFVFHAPLCYYGEFYGSFEGIQSTAVEFVVNFAGGKFLFIFAFLFGYGIVLQQYSRSKIFKGYFIKRMLILLIFGVLHLILFWFGDILATYALLGLLVIPLLQLSNRIILLLSILFIFFRSLYYWGAVALGWPLLPPNQPEELETFFSVFQQGSYIEVLQLRMKELWAFTPENLVWYLPKTFGLFLLGIYAARKNLFTQIRENSKRYLIITSLLIVGSILWITYKMQIFNMVDLEIQPLWRPVLIGVNVFFETTLGVGYIIGFGILFQKSELLSNLLSTTGRLALTNYILQSLICVMIFYSYGLGYYGKLRPTDLIFLSIGIFIFNIVFSTVYLKFKPIGPLEYLWRRSVSIEKI